MTLQLGFIGCGDITGYMAWMARLNRRVTVTGCCDRSEDAAASFAARHRIPYYTAECHKLLAHSQVDAVYIATPHHLHDQMLRDALYASATRQGTPVRLT